MTIHVHIERIVLDGLALSAKDAGPVRRAVERELAGIFAAPAGRATPWRAANVARVQAAAAPVDASAGPRAVGRDVARAIGGVLRP